MNKISVNNDDDIFLVIVHYMGLLPEVEQVQSDPELKSTIVKKVQEHIDMVVVFLMCSYFYNSRTTTNN